MKDKASIGFGVACVVSFVLTVVLLAMDRTSSGTISAGLTLSMGLFCFLPTLESFQAFGLNAQFRKKLDEADELLGLLRETGSMSARLLAINLAHGSRFAPPQNVERLEQMTELNSVIGKLALPEARTKQIQRPFIKTAAFDLANVYFNTSVEMRGILAQRYSETVLTKLPADHTEVDIRGHQEIMQRMQAPLHKDAYNLEISELIEEVKSETPMFDFLTECGLTAEERSRLETLQTQVLRLINYCLENGNLNLEAAKLLDERDKAIRDRWNAMT